MAICHIADLLGEGTEAKAEQDLCKSLSFPVPVLVSGEDLPLRKSSPCAVGRGIRNSLPFKELLAVY